jgi:hypothetical protein
MYPSHVRRMFTAALLVAVFAVPSHAEAAGRRRAVAPPTAGHQLTAAEITGTVLDEVTGQPVVAAKVQIANRKTTTDTHGAFKVKNVVSYHGVIVVEASRSGYKTNITNLNQGGDRALTLRVQPLPTVRVRRTNNTTVDIDFESLEFGFPSTFSGYQSAPSDDFCKPDGTKVTIDRSEIRRITGPAVRVQQAPCCSTRDVLRINAELKSGETTPLFFTDSCTPITSLDLIGRNHVTGAFEFTAFTDIAEIVFP